MPPSPILNAEYLLRKAFRDAFVPLLGAYVDSAGRVKCYWKRADQLDANKVPVTVPYLIYQPQSNIAPLVWLNEIDAEGLFTIRALAPNQSAAETLLGIAIPGLASLSISGYKVMATYNGSPNIPPDDADVWTVAHIYRITLSAV